jgi:3-phenylpropionate/cinnamic acid dioxygenase small subunit
MSARSGIENTLYRLAWGTDRRDIESIRASYASDARWAREVAPGETDLVLEGRDAIEGHLQETWAKTPRPNAKHVITNVLIDDETDDRAEVTSYKTVVRVVDGKPTIASSGAYRDVFVNLGGTWRVQERVLLPDGQI